MIDGLESESAGRVCVTMATIAAGCPPPALVRSGRVEVWLEMRLPDPEARAQILADHLNNRPEELRQPNVPRLNAASEGGIGTDLERLVGDGKAI